jgi:hypothetical protein
MVLVNTSSSQSFTPTFYELDGVSVVFEMVHGDFDGDGVVDVISSSYVFGTELWLRRGADAPNDFTIFHDEFSIQNLVVVDFDMDGDLDLVGGHRDGMASYVWLNDGAANFERELLSVPYYSAIHFDDVDDDGVMDAVVAFDNELNLYSVVNGELLLQQALNENGFPFNTPTTSIDYLDVDGDGNLEICASSSTEGAYLFRNDGSGTFVEERLAEFNGSLANLDYSDLDQDGDIDFVSSADFNPTTVYLDDYEGFGFLDGIVIPNPIANVLYTEVVDIDSDGVAEIVQFEGGFGDTGISIFKYDASVDTFARTVISREYGLNEAAAIVDLDNDGDLDIFTFTHGSQDTGVVVYIQEPMTSSTTKVAPLDASIYPNPTSDLVNISVDDEMDYTVTIYNQTGQQMYQALNVTQVNLQAYQSGFYILKLADLESGKGLVEKILVE